MKRPTQILLFLGLGLSMKAQTTGTIREKMFALQTEYRAKLIEATRSLDVKFAAHLAKLEAAAVTAGDYQQAEEIRKRRLNVESGNALISPLFGSVAGSILLKPSNARLSGKARYDSATQALLGFKSTGCTAEWRESRIAPGTYDVMLLYSLGRDIVDPTTFETVLTGGSYRFFEDTKLSLENSNVIEAQVEPTRGWMDFKRMKIGQFGLQRTSATFKLEVLSANPGRVMMLRGIELVPVKAVRGHDRALADIKAAHEVKLKEIRTPIVTNHLAYLANLEKLAKERKDMVTLNEIKEEEDWTRRILAGGELTTAASDTSKSRFRTAQLTGVPPVSGSVFSIVVNGRTVPVRLYQVDAPNVSETLGATLTAFQNYFGISLPDAQELGRLSAQHTQEMLGRGNFLVREWGQQDADGRTLIQVRVPDLGDYGRILLLKGLAARSAALFPKGIFPIPPGSEHMTDTYLEAEKRAKEDQNGAWSLGTGGGSAF